MTPAFQSGALPAALRFHVEIRAGLEPVIAAVKGLCPNHLDEADRDTGHLLPNDCVARPGMKKPLARNAKQAALNHSDRMLYG